jgi:hypothetical protein
MPDDGPRSAQYLKETTVAGHIQTRLSEAPRLHKAFAQPWHVVTTPKLNLHTHARAHVILLSRALTLAYAPLVDDYRLRCHIECNCRDAK